MANEGYHEAIDELSEANKRHAQSDYILNGRAGSG